MNVSHQSDKRYFHLMRFIKVSYSKTFNKEKILKYAVSKLYC